MNREVFLEEWRHILAPYTVGYRLRLLSQLLTRNLQDILEPYGLTPFHWVVLCCLWQEDGLGTSVLCERLDQVGGTLTGVLDRMEERGLVHRSRDNRDRRVWRIWLTPQGNELRNTLPPLALGMSQRILTGFSPCEYELFSQLLDRMIANLKN